MQDHKKSFDLAMTVTRAGNLFTTHTAVAAGFDRFDPQLMRKYLHHYAEDELAIPMEMLLAMGTRSGNPAEDFNMAYLAVRGSGQINGVSQLHGQVSRQIFRTTVSRLARAGGTHRFRDQRDSRTDMGLRRSRCSLDHSLRQETLARRGYSSGRRPATERRTVMANALHRT